MLRDEHWMAAVRSLFAVTRRVLRRQACIDEPTRMLQNRLQSSLFQIPPLLLAKMKSLPELRTRQPGTHLVQCPHAWTPAS